AFLQVPHWGMPYRIKEVMVIGWKGLKERDRSGDQALMSYFWRLTEGERLRSNLFRETVTDLDSS
ncbi:MAG: hypothetical protein ACO3EZ_17390, partial [Prochlorotrichaceae cyanobacterium]